MATTAVDRAVTKLFEAIQECISAGMTANEVREEVAECWMQANLDTGKDGKRILLRRQP